MGQKTHPKGFRLIANQKYLSNWYTTKFYYALIIKEDYFIRFEINKFFKSFLIISNININRIIQKKKDNEFINIIISALYPRTEDILTKILNLYLVNTNDLKEYIIIILKQIIKNFIRFIQIKTNKIYSIKIKFIKNSFEDANLIAKYLIDQLEKRISYKRTINEIIKQIQDTNIKGIKIQLSGRLNGVDIANSEWKRYKKIPLHTLNAKIDYTCQIAKTIFGIIGIKIWLYLF